MQTTNTTPEISSYQQQAIDFLKSASTAFHVSYKSHDFYFPDDKQSRDIWYVTLKNDSHRYRFTFGQSIANTGYAPNEYDVLASVTKNDPGTFENFCSEFGYDADSKTAEKTYKAIVKEWQNIKTLFTPDQLNQLQEIQ